MATKIGVGLSLLVDSYQAGQSALADALDGFDRDADCLILIFSTDNHDHDILLRSINEKIERKKLIGFTAAGIFSGQQMSKAGVLITAFQGADLDFHCAVETDLSQDQKSAGFGLGETFTTVLKQTDKNALQLLFPDGLTNTVSCMLDALFHSVGSRTLYAGGASGDNFRFVETCQYFGDQVLNDAVVGALITSSKFIAVAAAHGWTPISSPMIVTRAENNVIYELDWQPAYEVYRDFARISENIDIDNVGFPEFSMSHPFGIPQAKEEDGYIVRDPVAKNDDGSITCIGEVPANSVLRVLNGNKDSLLAAVKSATESVVSQLKGQPLAGVLVFSCASRCLFLDDAFFDEIVAIKEIIGDAVPVSGCLTFGEIGTIGNGPPEFHNKSIVICAFPQ